MKVSIVMGCNHCEENYGNSLEAYKSHTQATQVVWELNNYYKIKESRDSELGFVSIEDEFRNQPIYDYYIVKEVEVQ